MQPHNLFKNNAGDNAIRKLAVKVKRMDRLIRVVQADLNGVHTNKNFETITEWLQFRTKKLSIQSSAPKPIILGRHLIKLKLQPGPNYRKILDNCFEAQLDGIFVEEEDGIIYLKSFLKDQNYI